MEAAYGPIGDSAPVPVSTIARELGVPRSSVYQVGRAVRAVVRGIVRRTAMPQIEATSIVTRLPIVLTPEDRSVAVGELIASE